MQAGRQADRQAGRQAHRQTDTQTVQYAKCMAICLCICRSVVCVSVVRSGVMLACGARVLPAPRGGAIGARAGRRPRGRPKRWRRARSSTVGSAVACKLTCEECANGDGRWPMTLEMVVSEVTVSLPSFSTLVLMTKHCDVAPWCRRRPHGQGSHLPADVALVRHVRQDGGEHCNMRGNMPGWR